MPRETLPGSPEPADSFEPHLPGVDLPDDIGSVFVKARAEIANPSAQQKLDPGQRCLGIVTPGRMVMIVPAPKPGTVPAQSVEQVRQLIPSERPLNITVVSYTKLEPLMKDKAKCIPFLGELMGFAYLGHSVLVFEGHPSAFEAGVRGSDVLLIDSAMLAFLDRGWARAAFAAMNSGAKVFVKDRKTLRMTPVLASDNEQGWRYGEPDGEASYTNCLLTALARAASAISVRIAAGEPVPDLAPFAANERGRQWAAELPFRYSRLDAAKVIAILQKIVKFPEPQQGVSRALLKTQLALPGGQRQAVAFELTLTAASAHPVLEILRKD